MNESSEPLDHQAERFLTAMRDGNAEEARGLLDACPDVARFSIHTAAASGTAGVVSDMLRRDTSLVAQPHGREEWPPLAYACASRLHAIDVFHAKALLETATILLDAGASANSFTAWFDATGRKYPNPVLYHACMSDHPALVARLLERGANPNDGESIYHAAQYNRRSCLELLRQHGADFSSRQKPYNNTPLFFLAGHHDEHGGNAPWAQGVRWLLEHGADPNVTSYGHNSTPLHALATGGRDQVLRWVVEWGADVNAVRRDGRTPYAIALRSGNEAGARYLIEQGASPGATPMDEFLGACLTADEPVARSLLERHTDLMSSMTAEDQGAIGNAIRWNRPHAVRLMHTLGFQLNWEEAGGGTPLHWAAWLGRHEIVKLLLELGAPVNARDRQYGSSPIAWAAHGSRFNNHEGADDHYCAIVDVLIDAGAERTVSINKAGVPPEILATPRVQEKLVERGFA